MWLRVLALVSLVGCGTPASPDVSPVVSSDGSPALGATSPPWRPGYVRPPVIDIHTHVMPSGLERFGRIMADNGLARAANLSGAPVEGFEVEDKVRELFPVLVPFFNLDWETATEARFGGRSAEGLDKAVREHGYKGLKIPKLLGLYLEDAAGERVPVDWPELDPLWKKAGELGVPVAIHAADPAAFWLPPTPDNERYDELEVHPKWSFHGPGFPPRKQILAELERVFARHPGTTFISVHFGNNAEELDDVDRVLDAYPNVMIDTAARLGEIGRHSPEKVRAFFVKHKGRVLFGTDLGVGRRGLMLGSSGRDEPTMADVKPFFDAHWRFFEGDERQIPHPTPIQGRWKIDAINLPDDVLEALYFRNACRVLGIDPATLAP